MTKSRGPDSSQMVTASESKNLYKSNLLRLQVEELITNSTPKYDKLKMLMKTVASVEEILKTEIKPKEWKNFREELKGSCFFWNHSSSSEGESINMSFKAPESLHPTGSYELHCIAKPLMSVDLAVVIPSSCFKERDFLNGKYLDRRNAYVVELARQVSVALKKKKVDATAEIGLMGGDERRPVVEVKLGGTSKNWSIRLLPVGNFASLWNVSKLHKSRNCYRMEKAGPTYEHNHQVLTDMEIFSGEVRSRLSAALKKFPGLAGGVQLVKLWAFQRGFLGSSKERSMVSGFALSILALHAADVSGSSPVHLSPYQIFRLTLVALSQTTFGREGIQFGVGTKTLTARGAFLCGEAEMDLFWNLSSFDLQEISLAAQKSLATVDLISQPVLAPNVFGMVFGERAKDLREKTTTWDFSLKLVVPSSLDQPEFEGLAVDVEASDDCTAHVSTRLARQVVGLLKKGLSDRVSRFETRRVGESLLVGGVLNCRTMNRQVDKGPPADDAEKAGEWKAFWEERAQIRRFADGTILECAVWEASAEASPVEQIIDHVLGTHLKEATVSSIIVNPLRHHSLPLAQSKQLWAHLSAFRAMVSSLSDNLPVSVKDVKPVDPRFSYSEAFASKRKPVEVVVEFDPNGGWPEHQAAIMNVKAALLLKMRELLLQGNFKGGGKTSVLAADIGLPDLEGVQDPEGVAQKAAEAALNKERAFSKKLNSVNIEPFMDIKLAGDSEALFRVRIFHPHELMEVARQVTSFERPEKRLDASHPGFASLYALWFSPILRAQISGLAGHFPTLPAAIVLAKKWMDKHLLLDSCGGLDDFVELSMAHIFSAPLPHSETPQSATVGFLRWLAFVKNFEWQTRPLLTLEGEEEENLEDEELQEELKRLNEKAKRKRLSDLAKKHDETIEKKNEMLTSLLGAFNEKAGKACWLASRFDPHALLCASPSPLHLERLKRHATVALQKVLGSGKEEGEEGLLTIDLLMRPERRPALSKCYDCSFVLSKKCARQDFVGTLGALSAILKDFVYLGGSASQKVVVLKWIPRQGNTEEKEEERRWAEGLIAATVGGVRMEE